MREAIRTSVTTNKRTVDSEDPCLNQLDMISLSITISTVSMMNVTRTLPSFTYIRTVLRTSTTANIISTLIRRCLSVSSTDVLMNISRSRNVLTTATNSERVMAAISKYRMKSTMRSIVWATLGLCRVIFLPYCTIRKSEVA